MLELLRKKVENTGDWQLTLFYTGYFFTLFYRERVGAICYLPYVTF